MDANVIIKGIQRFTDDTLNVITRRLLYYVHDKEYDMLCGLYLTISDVNNENCQQRQISNTLPSAY